MKADSIALGLRIGQLVDPAFFVSWTRMIRSGLDACDQVLMPAVQMPHSCACNVLAWRFLQTDCDSLLMMDDDMVFEPSAVADLADTQSDHGIVSALYTTRREPVKPIALWWNGKRYAGKPDSELRGLVDCDVVGFGFTLISRPLIEAVCKERGKDGIFTWSNTHGEDGEFCVTAARLGYKVAVNCDVVVGHRVSYTSRWNAAEQVVDMGIEDFGMNSKQPEERQG